MSILYKNARNVRFVLFRKNSINCCSYSITSPNGQFFKDLSKPDGWFHSVMNYIGPNNGQGIQVFQNGESVANATTLHSIPTIPGDGEIAIGKFHIAIQGDYGSVAVDELVFFEQVLSLEEIRALSKHTTS